jgi:fluoroquinolone resistance protein
MPTQTPAPGQTFDSPDWRGVDLGDRVFDACTIKDGAFADATASGARFTRCRLTRCVFTHTNLREAVFENCVFADPSTQSGADFAFARLDETRFTRCDLTHARFEGADLYGATFETCNLLGARFPRARFHRAFGRKVVRAAVGFIDCNLELADLAGANLAECDFARSRLRETDLSGCDLEGASLRDADLFQAIIDNARMAGADLRGAEVSGFDLRRLASYADLKITTEQQFHLLDAIGVDVHEKRT